MKKQIKVLIDEYIKNNHGKLYAPIPHPDFKNLEASHPDRMPPIIDEIKKLKKPPRNGIDIGSHWGDACYALEDIGIDMTAVESYVDAFNILTALRDECKRSFKTIHSNVFDIMEMNYDLIIALNIFHHFIKTKDKHDKFIKLLNRLDCEVMFFQAHNPLEGQMSNAYKNYPHDVFVKLIVENSKLNDYRIIVEGRRPIYMITK